MVSQRHPGNMYNIKGLKDYLLKKYFLEILAYVKVLTNVLVISIYCFYYFYNSSLQAARNKMQWWSRMKQFKGFKGAWADKQRSNFFRLRSQIFTNQSSIIISIISTIFEKFHRSTLKICRLNNVIFENIPKFQCHYYHGNSKQWNISIHILYLR